MTDAQLCRYYDNHPNLTLNQLAEITGRSFKALKTLLLEHDTMKVNQTLNFDDLIGRTHAGYFAAYHPVTRLRIGTYDSWSQALAAISEAAK